MTEDKGRKDQQSRWRRIESFARPKTDEERSFDVSQLNVRFGETAHAYELFEAILTKGGKAESKYFLQDRALEILKEGLGEARFSDLLNLKLFVAAFNVVLLEAGKPVSKTMRDLNDFSCLSEKDVIHPPTPLIPPKPRQGKDKPSTKEAQFKVHPLVAYRDGTTKVVGEVFEDPETGEWYQDPIFVTDRDIDRVVVVPYGDNSLSDIVPIKLFLENQGANSHNAPHTDKISVAATPPVRVSNENERQVRFAKRDGSGGSYEKVKVSFHKSVLDLISDKQLNGGNRSRYVEEAVRAQLAKDGLKID